MSVKNSSLPAEIDISAVHSSALYVDYCDLFNERCISVVGMSDLFPEQAGGYCVLKLKDQSSKLSFVFEWSALIHRAIEYATLSPNTIQCFFGKTEVRLTNKDRKHLLLQIEKLKWIVYVATILPWNRPQSPTFISRPPVSAITNLHHVRAA